MKRYLSLVYTTVLFIPFSMAASADVRASTSCAAALTTDQRLIYHSVMLEFTPEANLPVLVRTKVIALVTAGRLPMSSAPDDAKIAIRCLQMVRQ